MRVKSSGLILAAILASDASWGLGSAPGGELTVELGKSAGVTLVGAIRRWDGDGKARVPVDPQARIDSPRVDARAEPGPNGRWVFHDLAEGQYDLVVLAAGRIRVEGFSYPPINEFDPFLSADARAPEDDTEDWIVRDIARARHYENKVSPLFMAGEEKQVRILVQLVRDEPTSFDSDFGAPAATVRHEIWQYTHHYGGWVKDRSTKILDRVLMARSEFRLWTWVWQPRLGGIKVGEQARHGCLRAASEFRPQVPSRVVSQLIGDRVWSRRRGSVYVADLNSPGRKSRPLEPFHGVVKGPIAACRECCRRGRS